MSKMSESGFPRLKDTQDLMEKKIEKKIDDRLTHCSRVELFDCL